MLQNLKTADCDYSSTVRYGSHTLEMPQVVGNII